MNLRNAVSILTTLTLAGTALCQAPALERVAPKKGHDYTWVANQPLDLVIVLASWRNLTTNVCGQQVLAGGTVLTTAMALAAGLHIDVDLPPCVAKLLNDSDLYVQAIAVKAAPVLMIDATPAEKLQVARDVPGGKPDDITWSADETEALFKANLEWLHVSHLINDEQASTFSLYAEFTGRTSGYGLKSAGSKVVDGRTQVWLQLQVPGEGEGDLTIVEMHQLLLDLGKDGGSTDVHVSITDGRRRTAFRPFGSFDPK